MFESIVDGFVEALLWSSHSDEDESRDFTDLGPHDLSSHGLAAVYRLVGEFVTDWRITPILHDLDCKPEQIGHDLALTVNGHGVGFNDREFYTHLQKCLLDKVASTLGPVEPFVNSDNLIDVE